MGWSWVIVPAEIVVQIVARVAHPVDLGIIGATVFQIIFDGVDGLGQKNSPMIVEVQALTASSAELVVDPLPVVRTNTSQYVHCPKALARRTRTWSRAGIEPSGKRNDRVRNHCVLERFSALRLRSGANAAG
jgi:hypothetical protein